MTTPRFIQNITGFTLFVPSVEETTEWYEKHLGFQCEGYGEHAMIKVSDTNYIFHLLRSDDNGLSRITGNNATCFLFVEGLEAMREKILNTGWDKVSEIIEEGWGTKLFYVNDLNGFELRICEWNTDSKGGI